VREKPWERGQGPVCLLHPSPCPSGISPRSSGVRLGMLAVLSPADDPTDFQRKVSVLEVSVLRPEGAAKIL